MERRSRCTVCLKHEKPGLNLSCPLSDIEHGGCMDCKFRCNSIDLVFIGPTNYCKRHGWIHRARLGLKEVQNEDADRSTI